MGIYLSTLVKCIQFKDLTLSSWLLARSLFYCNFYLPSLISVIRLSSFLFCFLLCKQIKTSGSYVFIFLNGSMWSPTSLMKFLSSPIFFLSVLHKMLPFSRLFWDKWTEIPMMWHINTFYSCLVLTNLISFRARDWSISTLIFLYFPLCPISPLFISCTSVNFSSMVLKASVFKFLKNCSDKTSIGFCI